MNVVDVVAPILYLTYPVRCTPQDSVEPWVYIQIQSDPEITQDENVPIRIFGLEIWYIEDP